MSGHGPIEQEQRQVMNGIANILDQTINPDPDKREWGFALLVFRFGDGADNRMNYISNAPREDMLTALKEFIAHSEGRVGSTSTPQ